METSIVIATFNKLDYTQQCIESIREYTEPGSYEIIVVDNRSTDGTVDWLKAQPDIRTVFNDENLGFPKACNQGIEISTGDNILLLNNDTIVTRNWLTNLLISLYSSGDIGAVGSVTNNCSYGQAIPVSYGSLAEMQSFAVQNNQSKSSEWEERLKLIGYCMLIKKSVIDEVGLLDERFTPGNYEDDDISLRIRLAGYKLLLCKDTFIHHYGSVSFRDAPPEYIRLMENNRQKFAGKWGYDPDQGNHFRLDICSFLEAPANSDFHVLEIGCGCGGNLLQIRHRYAHAQLSGTEPNPQAAAVASKIAAVRAGGIADLAGNLPVSHYDWIIVSEPVSRWDNPELMLTRIRGMLKQNGRLLVVLPNSLHFSRVKPFLLGFSPARANDGFTVAEAQDLFEKAGFGQTSMTALVAPVSAEDRAFIQSLAGTAGIDTTTPYETSEILVSATNISDDSVLKTLVNQIISQTDVEQNVKQLARQDEDAVFALIEQAGHEQQEELFNYLAVQLLENGEAAVAQQYLQRVFERNPGNEQTLFNLGLAMYTMGHREMALEWFELLNEKTEQVLNWITQLREEIGQQKFDITRTRHLLRRIEFDLNGEEAMAELLPHIREGKVTVEDLTKEAVAGLIRKSEVLALVAEACLKHGIYKPITGLMEQAINMEPSDATLYRLASVLYEIGEQKTAITFLELIKVRDEAAEDLFLRIKGAARV